MVFQSIKAVEDPVVEELLAQLIPDMLNWIEFWRIGRQPEQENIGGGFELVASVPTRAVDHHDDVLLCVATRHFIEKHLHALGIDVRQDQTVKLAGADIHRTVGVGVLVRQHGLAQWAHWFGCPATAHVRDAAKARLVLEHQLEWLALRPVLVDLTERFGKFFFHSS